MNYDVFISYSNKDKTTADAIVNHLENNNIKCWYAPRDIETGKEWADAIVQAIESTKIMVLIFTDYSNASPQVRREVDNAISRGMTIIPFKLTDQLPSGSMEYYLSTLHWLDAMNEPLEKAINELCFRVTAIMEGSVDGIEGASKKAGLLKYKPLNRTARRIVGFVSFPVIFLGLFMVVCGFVGLSSGMLYDGLLLFFFGLTFIFPGAAGLWMFFNRRILKIIQFVIIGALSAFSFFICSIVNMLY